LRTRNSEREREDDEGEEMPMAKHDLRMPESREKDQEIGVRGRYWGAGIWLCAA
jgi:hypothetical protein